MRNPFLFWFGLIMILFGFAFLVDQTFGFTLFRYIWPVGLIVAGIAVILQRGKSPDYELVKQSSGFISEINRNGRWQVENERFSAFISDMTLDLSEADIPKGETVFDISGFIGDINIRVPDDVPVMVSSSSFISEVSAPGMKEGGVFGPTKVVSDGYDTAVHKIRVQSSHFISDITVQTSGYPAVETIKEKSPSMLA